MAAFVVDTMTDTAGTTLTSHTGETGATWTKHSSFTGPDMVITDANRLRANTGTNKLVYASGTPPGVEYSVKADIIMRSDDNSSELGVSGRIDTSANTQYYAYYSTASDLWLLRRRVAGSVTAMGSSAATLTVDQAYALELRITDAAKKLLVDTVELISDSDNTITSAGKAGVYGAGNAVTNSTGLHLDNFNADDVPAGTPATVTAVAATATAAGVAPTPITGTAQERISAIHISSPWRGPAWLPTGSITSNTRAAVVHLYSDIPGFSGNATVSAVAATATAAGAAPTIVVPATIAGVTATATAAAGTPTVTAAATIAGVAGTATAAGVVPVIIFGVGASAATATATALVPAYTLSALVAALAATATATANVPQIDNGQARYTTLLRPGTARMLVTAAGSAILGIPRSGIARMTDTPRGGSAS